METRAGTEEEAANLALAHLRQPPLARLDDKTSRARAIKAVFAAVRDRTLRREWWNFATGWQPLALAVGLTHPSKLQKIYPLPADCLLVREVQDLSVDQWAVEAYVIDPAGTPQMCLITNADNPVIHYTRRSDSPHLWDPEFLLAFSFDLAGVAGPQLGISVQRTAELLGMARADLDSAAMTDAQEKAKSEVRGDTSWLRARGIGAR